MSARNIRTGYSDTVLHYAALVAGAFFIALPGFQRHHKAQLFHLQMAIVIIAKF